jgi:hypothetical protein
MDTGSCCMSHAISIWDLHGVKAVQFHRRSRKMRRTLFGFRFQALVSGFRGTIIPETLSVCFVPVKKYQNVAEMATQD